MLRFASCMSVACLALLFVGAKEGDDPKQAQEIDWMTDALQASIKARDSGQPLLAYFHADWCVHCKSLTNETFADEAFQAYADQGVFLKIADDNEDPDAQFLRKELKIESYPQLIVLSVSANRINEQGRIVGYYGPEEYVRQLSQLVKKPSEPAAPRGLGSYLSERAKCSPDDIVCSALSKSPLASLPLPTSDPQPTPRKEPVDRADLAGVGKMLKEAGYMLDPQLAEQKFLSLTVKDRDWTFYLRTELSPGQQNVWITATLVTGVDLEQTPTAALARLLRLNTASGRAILALSQSNNLTIAIPLENDGLTPRRLKSAIDDLISVARTTSPEWNKLPVRPSASS